MFTGIITNAGIVESISRNNKSDILLQVSTLKKNVSRTLEIGCSIACNGICLTLLEKKISGQKVIFSFQASKETEQKTTLNQWQIGQEINLEFALRVGDELGGHMVLGHVDATAKIIQIKKIKDSHLFEFQAPKDLLPFIVKKGSVTIDGISLTVNETNSDKFSINAIKHTLENTNLQHQKIGNLVNLEIDTLARYILNSHFRSTKQGAKTASKKSK